MKQGRLQLTLFVPEPSASIIEKVRRLVDPIQHAKISAHVTLVREDELAGISLLDLQTHLACSPQPALTLQFGAPVPFAEHGMLLPCIGGEAFFHRLRTALLGAETIRRHQAHITLAHPRNPRAPDNTASAYSDFPAPLTVVFGKISLIEEVDGQPWQVRAEYDLSRSDS